MGSEIHRPAGPEDDEYRIIFRFDHESNLHAWETSEERRRWLDKCRPLLKEEEKVSVLTGLENWFTLPSKPPPPRYKMAAVTYLAVVPIVTIIFSLFGHWLNLLPVLLRTVVFSAVMVTLMTYVIMPRMTRLFSFWLYRIASSFSGSPRFRLRLKGASPPPRACRSERTLMLRCAKRYAARHGPGAGGAAKGPCAHRRRGRSRRDGEGTPRRGPFEDASACLRLIEQHAALGKDVLGLLLDS